VTVGEKTAERYGASGASLPSHSFLEIVHGFSHRSDDEETLPVDRGIILASG